MDYCLITGGASGLGENISRYLASKKINLIILYNSSSNSDNLKEELESKFGISVITIKCDISNESDIENVISIIKDNGYNIKYLVNNAAVCYNAIYEDKNKEDFMKTLEVNLVGTFLISRRICDMMYENKSGVVVNISSNNSTSKYYPMTLDYDASKAGLNSLTHNLALQYAPYVRVNAVAPGYIKTPSEMKDIDEEFIKCEEEKIFVNRLGEMEEVSSVIYFLLSDDASYINNQIITVDGGTYGG